MATARHARRLSEGHRLPRIPAVPDHRHAAGRRQAEGRPAARVRRRATRPPPARRRAPRTDAGGEGRPVPAAGPRPLGAPARPRHRPGAGTRRVARREPRRATRTSRGCRRRSRRRCSEAGLTPQKAFDLLSALRREDRGAQHRRPDAPAHLSRASRRPRCWATRPTSPTSSPTASPSWSSRSGRRGRTSCSRSSRC